MKIEKLVTSNYTTKEFHNIVCTFYVRKQLEVPYYNLYLAGFPFQIYIFRTLKEKHI